MERMEIQTPAKVNLFLDILGTRADGYHEIRSLLLPVSLYDRLTFEDRPEGLETRMESDLRWPGIPWPMGWCRPDDNLVTRAARLLREATGHGGGARITLQKQIPVGAGLGGGSSDAAAVLTGLNALWGTGLNRSDLMALGIRLGCDIPAFIHGGAVCMEGVGERITPMSCGVRPPLWLLLAYPGFAVSTRDVYTRYSGLTPSRRPVTFDPVAAGLQRGSADQVAAGLYNALELTVFRKYPLLAILKNKLEQAGALGVQLTGSGSTVYAVARDEAHGRELEARLRATLDCPIWTAVVRGA